MSRLAALVVRFRVAVVAAWLVALVAATMLLPGLESASETPVSGLVAKNSPAIAAERRGIEIFEVPLLSRVAVVQRNPAGLTAAQQGRAIARAVPINQRVDPVLGTVVFALPIPNTSLLFPEARETGTTVITYLQFENDASLRARDALAHTYWFRIAADRDWPIGVTGPIPARLAQWDAIGEALPRVELATVALLLLIVGLTFRAPGAPLLVLAAAALAFLIAVRVVSGIGSALDVTVPREIEPVMVVLLLGVVTDYAVFFLFGVKRRLRQGLDPLEATRETAERYLPIVTTAGLIVVLGTAALLVSRLEFFRAFGPGAAVTVLIGLLVSTTFVPAVLALAGERVFWPSVAAVPDEEEREHPLQERLVRAIQSPRVALPLAAGTVALLVVCALGLLRADLGFTLIRGLPEGSEVQRAAEAAQAGFAEGIVSPTEVLVEGPSVGEDLQKLSLLQVLIDRQLHVAGVVGPRELPPEVGLEVFVDRAQNAARFVVVLDVPPLSATALDAIGRLRERLPGILERAGLPGARASLAGDTVIAEETVDRTTGDVGRIAFAALLVNFVLLALFLRALVAPLFLLAAAALALAASLGLTALVFQDGLGHTELTYYVPFAAAVLLLSLGSDYNLFLVGRIWQEAQTRSLPDALAYAVPRAASAINVAGVALALSFALLAIVELRPFREFAFAMCVGVLIDSFLVRTLLAPALISLVGTRSWWPGRLGRSGDPERALTGG